MAAYTSSQSGNWNSASTWGGAGIPGSGDTVTIADGTTVTVPSGYTAVCGTSPTNDTGTVALQCSSTTGTGVLVVNGTLKWQGPVRQANATWTVNAGGTLTYDASLAATPASALYTWQIAQASTQANALLQLSGSSGSHVAVNSISNYQSGGFGVTGTGWSDGGRMVATYTDFSYQGAATTSGNLLIARPNTSAASVTFDNCTIDNCGQIQIAALGGPGTFRLNQTRITNPVNSSFSVQIVGTTALTTGTRQITNNVVWGQIDIIASGAAATGFTIKNNVFRVQNATTAHNSIQVTSGGSVAAWDQNLIALITSASSGDSAFTPSATMTNTYVFRMGSPTTSNTHPIYHDCRGGSAAFTGWIFEYTGTDANSDMIQTYGGETATADSLSITHCLFLPNAAGDVIGSYFNNSYTSLTLSATQLTFDHNTALAGGSNGSFVYGIGCEATGAYGASSIASVRSNLLYRNASGTGMLFNSSNTGSVADGAVTTSDYNCSYNVTGDYYHGNLWTVTKFSATPGTHDIVANPQFVDGSRNLFRFDQGYLNKPVGTAWANSTSYNVGDVVSFSNASFHGGATYNFVCVQAHTSDLTTTEPTSGSAYQAYWEPASLKYIQDDVLAGNTYSGGTNSLIGEMVAWVKKGFAPQNSALHNTAHDGTDIGAVAFQPSGGLLLSRRRKAIAA